MKYDDAFFNWLGLQILMIDDYAYAGLEFWGDPDLVLPEESQWGDLGKKGICFLQCFYEFFFFKYLIFLCFRSKD